MTVMQKRSKKISKPKVKKVDQILFFKTIVCRLTKKSWNVLEIDDDSYVKLTHHKHSTRVPEEVAIVTCRILGYHPPEAGSRV